MKWKELIPILSILVGCFLILIFLKSIWNDLTYLRCISSTPEMIVFQTGPLKPLGVAISGLVYILMALLFPYYTISEIKNWKNERQSQNMANMKDMAKLIGWFLVFCLSVVFTIAVIFYVIADNVSSEKIVISNYEQVIDIEKHYLLGNEEHIRISFDQIDHILYGNYNGGNAEDRPLIQRLN